LAIDYESNEVLRVPLRWLWKLSRFKFGTGFQQRNRLPFKDPPKIYKQCLDTRTQIRSRCEIKVQTNSKFPGTNQVQNVNLIIQFVNS